MIMGRSLPLLPIIKVNCEACFAIELLALIALGLWETPRLVGARARSRFAL